MRESFCLCFLAELIPRMVKLEIFRCERNIADCKADIAELIEDYMASERKDSCGIPPTLQEHDVQRLEPMESSRLASRNAKPLEVNHSQLWFNEEKQLRSQTPHLYIESELRS